MDAPWRIRLLGALRAETGDLTITRFATSRVAVLLARLALFPRRAHSREELCDLLWPEADLTAGRLNLRVAIASLRRQLEPPPLPAGSVLIADRSFVSLNPAAFRCDVAEFEAACAKAARTDSSSAKRDALARAAALYGDDLLPGFYDDWIMEDRERLTALHEELRAQRGNLGARLPPTEDALAGEAAPEAIRADSPPRVLRLPLQFTLEEFAALTLAEGQTAQAARLLGSGARRLLRRGRNPKRGGGDGARRRPNPRRARRSVVCGAVRGGTRADVQ